MGNKTSVTLAQIEQNAMFLLADITPVDQDVGKIIVDYLEVAIEFIHSKARKMSS